MFGSNPAFAAKFFPDASVNFENLIAPFLVKRCAAHAFFHIVGASIGVFDDGLHNIIVLGNEHVARGYANLSLIHLRARLIETLFDVAQIEYHIIGSGLADDTDDLAFLYSERLSGIALDHRLTDD